MDLEEFSKKHGLLSLTEIEKVVYLCYYSFKYSGISEIGMADIVQMFSQMGYAKPNVARLKKRIADSTDLIKGSGKNSFRLHPKRTEKFSKDDAASAPKSEDISQNNSVLPEGLFKGTRGYIEKVCEQINATYEANCFDACAIMMRRCVEMLLIASYQNHGIESEILNAQGSHVMLSDIIDNVIHNKKLAVSKDVRQALDTFRTLGNYSAHKVYYNAKRHDIENCQKEFRLSIEELLYKAGLKK